MLAHHARADRGPTCSAGEDRSLTQGTNSWAALGAGNNLTANRTATTEDLA
jgi:hypothetical protein